jgi:hypothetical protein
MAKGDTYIQVTRGDQVYDLGVRLTPELLKNATPKQLKEWGQAVGVAYTNLLKMFREGK